MTRAMLRILTLTASIRVADLAFMGPKIHDCSCYAASPGRECFCYVDEDMIREWLAMAVPDE